VKNLVLHHQLKWFETIMNTPKLRFKNFSEELREVHLEDLGDVSRGKFTPRPRNDPRYFLNGTTPFIQTGDIVKAPLYIEKYSQFLNEEGVKVSKIFNAGTVFVTIAANIGDVAIAKESVACTDSVVGISPDKDKAISLWLKYYLDAKKSELDSKATQNAQKNINLQVLKPLKVFLPNLIEQQKIANLLSSLDKNISLLTQKYELLITYKKGVMRKIFNQEIRFRNDAGNDYPDWEIKSIRDCAEVIMGQSPSSSSYNQDGKGVFLIQGNADIKNRRTFPRAWTTENTKSCIAGDIILTVRAPVGAVAISDHDGCIGRGVCAIRVQKENSAGYIYQLLIWYESFKWKSLEQGSTFTAVNNNDIKALDCPIPSIEEQKKIASFLSALDDKISNVQKQIDLTKQYKQGLLQQMFV
jgi:type I restriction enzyme S subunit